MWVPSCVPFTPVPVGPRESKAAPSLSVGLHNEESQRPVPRRNQHKDSSHLLPQL